MMMGQLDFKCAKLNSDITSNHIQKLSQNGPSVRVKIMKLLEGNLGGENLCDLGLDKVFLDMTTKAQAIEEKKNKRTS